MANGAGFSMRVTGFCGLGQGTLAQCFASGSVEDIIQAPGDFCIAFEGHGETVPLTGRWRTPSSSATWWTTTASA